MKKTKQISVKISLEHYRAIRKAADGRSVRVTLARIIDHFFSTKPLEKP